MSRVSKAFQQFAYLRADLIKINGKHIGRWLSCWFGAGTIAIFQYRFTRFFYLLFGRGYRVLFTLLAPLRFLVRPWFITHCDISPRAEIGPGFSILHPTLGVVISAHTTAGKDLMLIGGNCIGIDNPSLTGERIVLGDDVLMGANASIIGFIRVGSNVRIGAGAVVIKNVEDKQIVVGIPAKPVSKTVS